MGGCSAGGTSGTKPSDTPPSILWLNGTYAVLTKINRGDVTIFGGVAHNNINKRDIMMALDDSWDVSTKAELDEMIDSLTVGRHNARFLDEIEEYEISYMSKSEFDEALGELDNRLDVMFFQNMFDAYQKFGENAIMGWDLSRAVQLCAYGYIADFYSYDEATDKARKVGTVIQKTFDSWDDFFASYLYGYEYWSEDDIEDANSSYVKRVKILDELKKDDKSPLHLDWHLDLAK